MQRRMFLGGLLALTTNSALASVKTQKPKHISLSNHDIKILTETLWGEARGEGDIGLRAVVHVICNRVHSNLPIFAKDTSIAKSCLLKKQFSCWKDPEMRHYDHKSEEARKIRSIAYEAVLEWNSGIDRSNRALFYFTKQIKKPDWANDMTLTRVIKNHKFYKPTV